MGLVGMRGKEAIGGRLHLTNYRLVFRSHRFNRVRGTFSVFLPCVEELRDTSFAVTRQVTVSTALQDLTFVVWGVPELIDTIDECRAEFEDNDAYIADLAALVTAEPWKTGHGLRTVAHYEALNTALLAARRRSEDLSEVASVVAGTIDGRSGPTEIAGASRWSTC